MKNDTREENEQSASSLRTVNHILTGDALTMLKTLPGGIVQTCVTSPPYFGLRDYGTAEWDGGNPECDHFKVLLASEKSTLRNDGREHTGPYEGEKKRTTGIPYKDICGKCGAVRIDQQIGLEESPEAYVEKLVQVFREVRQVLRDDGTLWINLGDTYANDTKWGGSTGGKHVEELHGDNATRRRRHTGLKSKDLIGIPWMVAFALRADGWYLRSDIIWSKSNCMPESVEDRPTKSHEYLFLLSKNDRYYYDNEAIKEPARDWGIRDRSNGKYHSNLAPITGGPHHGLLNGNNATTGRNKRSVWTVSTQSYEEAHFATFPPKLIEPCILAGTSPRACEVCGSPWERVTAREPMIVRNGPKSGGYGSRTTDSLSGTMIEPARTVTTGWQPTCACKQEGTGKCIILDPFMGAGTTALVAAQLGRDWLGIELNPEYVTLAMKRIATVQPRLWEGVA